MDKTDWTELCADVLEHIETASIEYDLYHDPDIDDQGFTFDLVSGGEYRHGRLTIEGWEGGIDWTVRYYYYESEDSFFPTEIEGAEDEGTFPLDAPMSVFDDFGREIDELLYNTPAPR